MSDQSSFIESSPGGKDLFDGQSQKRIAKSMAELICSNKPKSNLIGLEGSWGSGKSNLIKILEAELKNSHYFFVYDAWGHQEDLQRRSFLEELTEYLCNHQDKIKASEKWERKLKQLLARKRETTTKTVPHVSYFILFIFLAFVLTPITPTIAEAFECQGWHKVLVTITPLVLLLIGLSISLMVSLRKKHSLSQTFGELFAIYKGKELESETHVTISEKEPSVREFQKWMSDLSEALNSSETNRKGLIVVFDNMDRLPRNKVRELWSSIHTFFAEAPPDSDEKAPFKGIWVIVPFDRKHLSEAFATDLDISTNSTTSDRKHMSNTFVLDMSKDRESLSEEFLKKSFSVIYRVAPAVLTDWQKFFDLKFREAFGKREEEDLPCIRKTFSRLEKNVTPRNIIAFINDIVSLRMTVGLNVQLKYIAVFSLTKKSILRNPVNQILSRDYLGKASSLFVEDISELASSIAALVYLVPLESASQVALTPEIRDALNTGSVERISELNKHPHFVEILAHVILEEDFDIDKTVLALARLKHSKLNSLERITEIWDDLCNRVIQNPLSEQHFTDTHKLLLMRCSNSRRISLVKYLVQQIRKTDTFSGSKYYQALSDLCEFTQSNNLNIDILRMVTKIHTSAGIFIDYIRTAGKDYERFKLQCADESALLNYLQQDLIPDYLDNLSVLAEFNNIYNFSPTVEYLRGVVVSESNSLNAQNIEPFYEFYKALAREKPIEVIGSDLLVKFLDEVDNDSEFRYDLIAMCLAKGNEFSSYNADRYDIFNETAENKIDLIAKRIEYYKNVGDLLLGYLDWPQPILKVILEKLVDSDSRESRMDVCAVLKRYHNLKSSLGISSERFLRKLDGWSKYAKGRITEENILEYFIDNQELLVDATQIDCDLTQHLVNSSVKYLDSLAADKWDDVFHDIESPIWEMTCLLVDSEKLQYIPGNAKKSFRELLNKVARSEDEIDEQTIRYVSERCHRATLKVITKDIRNIYISEFAEISPDRFLLFADLLIRYGALEEKSKDVTKQILGSVIMDDRCLKLIVDNSDVFIPIIKAAGDDAKGFKDALKNRFLALPSADRKLGSFAKAIGVRRHRQ